jgi:2Fe-2S ferredoxin
MTTINFITPNGTRHAVNAEDGQSLMQTARAAGIDGIIAECNGNASCATCHVYVDERALPSLPPAGDQEDDLLTFTASERKACSRLSCQVIVSSALEGMDITIPPTQV